MCAVTCGKQRSRSFCTSSDELFDLASSRRYGFQPPVRADAAEGAASGAAAARRSAVAGARPWLGGGASEGGFGGGRLGLHALAAELTMEDRTALAELVAVLTMVPPRADADSRRGGGTHGSTLPRRRSTGGWSSDELDGPAFKHFRDADHDTISFYAGLPWGIAGYMGGAGELGPAGFFANSTGRRSIWKCVPRRPRAGPHWGSLLGDRRRAGHSLGTPAVWIDGRDPSPQPGEDGS